MQWNELNSHIRHLSTKDQKRVQQAFELGKKAHEGQKRKSGEPYFMHPIAVTHILADMGADADTLIAALLHDTVEDTDLTFEVIDEAFNGDVATLIDGVTKLTPEDVAEMPSMDDQIETLRKMFTVLEEDVRVMIIKLADRLHNMQTIEYLSEKRQEEMAQETLDVYVKIADRLSMQSMRDELEGLSYAVLDSAQHKKLVSIQEENESRGAKARKLIRKTLEADFSHVIDGVDMIYERKSWGKLRAQLHMEGNVATGVSAVTLVFVCEDVQQCYEVLGALHQSWPREALSFQDFINSPMINGYQGVHTTVILKDGTRIRCKIRTEDMHERARKGIALDCFDSEAVGLTEYIQPWAQHITTLSQDSKHQSHQFWESLQSDILGESIVIHGPDDRQILIPKGSTALDGAFHYYGDDALRAKLIRLDGAEAPFSTKLKNAVSLDVDFSRSKTVERGWIDWVQTGFSLAKIREALGSQPTAKRISIGQKLLQDVMTSKKKGFIEEFDTESIQKSLESTGYDSMDQIYIALAEGRIEATDIYKSLFEKKNGKNDNKKISFFQFSFPLADFDVIARMTDMYRKHRSKYKGFRMRWNPLSGLATVKVQLEANPVEAEEFVSDVEKAGGQNILTFSTAQTTLGILLGVSVLLLLWGLDPVFAEELLKSIDAPDLTFIRFAIFFIAASLLLGLQKFTQGPKLKRLNVRHPALFLSGGSLFLTAFFSYQALSHTNASVYILLIVLGVIISTLLNALIKKEPCTDLVIGCTLILVSIGVAFAVHNVSAVALLYAAGSSLSFSLYSLVSRRYQQEVEMIHARYPAFLFWLSLYILPFAIAILPFTSLQLLPPEILAKAIGFVLLFSIIPYGIYFECMKRMRQSILERSLPFVAVVALIGETTIHENWSAERFIIFALVGLSIYVIQFRAHSDS